MAINTPKPISRDERYLSKIGGNEEVIVPKPVSREEKYMYRAAGYDDQPIPDYPIGRNEKYWAKIVENGGGSGNGSTVTFDSGQKFISDNSNLKDYKIYGNGGEIHPTDVLPLTFTAKGGTAADWVIYGNDDNGTENLFDKTNAEAQLEAIPANGYLQGASSSYPNVFLIYIPVVEGEVYTFSISQPIPTTNVPLCSCFTISKPELGVSYRIDNQSTFRSEPTGSTTFTRTVPAGAKYMCVEIVFESVLENDIMIVKGSTAPDHYIPYQQGVGERTANLANVSNQDITFSNNYYKTILLVNSIEAGTYTLVYNIVTSVEPFNMSIGVGDKYYAKDITSLNVLSNGKITNTFTISNEYAGLNLYFMPVRYSTPKTLTITLSNVMLVKGSTAPSSYIPYGYEIPISVNNTPQTFYIGNSPLTAGQSISKTSTGVDIELFDGENTVSTTLYNKPTMEIETSYGVGVKDNNHYIIPFKVNTTIYNIQIGDSPLYDGEYLSYKEKKLYKYIDSVLTPIDPPSPFPEISTTEGVNKVIIETSTQPDSIFITTQNPIKLVQPNIGTKTITQNGVYNASDDNLDGYSSVTVNTN